MRIGDSYGKLAPAPTEASRKGATTTKASDLRRPDPGGGAVSGEKVTVSAEAQRLADQAASGSDDGKVESLKASIQNGSFQIDRQLVASRIVDGGATS